MLQIEIYTDDFFLLYSIMSLILDIPFLSSKICPNGSCRIIFHYKTLSSWSPSSQQGYDCVWHLKDSDIVKPKEEKTTLILSKLNYIECKIKYSFNFS